MTPKPDVVRERTVRWEDPLAYVKILQERTGLEYLNALCDGSIPAPPFALLMDFRVVEVAQGRTVFEADPAECHYNPGGAVHGGFALSLLDSALGCAVWSTLPAGSTYATTDVHARQLRPITKATGTVRCEAQVVSATRTLATAEGRIVDSQGKLLASGTTACAIYERH
jgi:uncharacterized protein (TIGR00369 family)